MALTPVFIDMETFWSTTHSLSKMNPIEYVMHPETELICMSVKIGRSPTAVIWGPDIPAFINTVNWDESWVIGHNMSGFDSMILAWRLGVRPRLWGCTLAMARPIHAKTTGLSLAKLVEFYGLGVKDKTALVNTRGKHLADFTVPERAAMGVYNKADTDQCAALFAKLLPHYSAKELWHIDTKIRALVEPSLVLDVPMLEDALARERAQKRKILLELADSLADHVLAGVDNGPVTEDYLIERVRATLASAPMFAAVLSSRQVPVPTKPSPTNPEQRIPALAKTDEAFLALREHDDPVVAAATEARLAVKSTLAETRMQLFLEAAAATGGRWPVPVNYCGADTTGRASGWLYNPLNMPRIDPKKPRITDALRMSVQAPPGYKVVDADLSGIELRVNHFLWRVPYSTTLWTKDPTADVYKAYAVMKFDVALDDVTKTQRQAAKIDQLGLGFGMGKDRYQDTARITGGLDLTPEEAVVAVTTWRTKHPEIVAGWRTFDKALSWVHEGMERPVDPAGLVWTCSEGLRLPSGRIIRYPGLHHESDCVRKDGWVYGEGRHRSWIFGAKSLENVVQGLARDVLYDVAYDVFQQTGRRPALEVYDELVYVVEEDQADNFLDTLQARMRAPVPWFPGLVTWSEGAVGDRYGEIH